MRRSPGEGRRARRRRRRNGRPPAGQPPEGSRPAGGRRVAREPACPGSSRRLPHEARGVPKSAADRRTSAQIRAVPADP
ncbi:hypothetical protein D7294_23875 [Streptomyces hoynatensis]|uniref:Uncharacterized protein n=1 Tax=Streptomyces hoynatensis TaxID=1141874 RepID=A0A3A9YT83_9ACTN|nr:hypothetical protein D7294_23875 [Streptomyces hoynatensis]